MNRSLRSVLALAVLLAAPGLAPYQAAAQVVGATRVAAPVVGIGAIGAVNSTLGGASAVLPAASVQANLVPTLTVAPALTPVVFSAPVVPTALSASPLAAPVHAAPLSPVAAAVVHGAPVALKSAVVSAALATEKTAPVEAARALALGADAVSAASKSDDSSAPKTALDAMFEGTEAKPDALSVRALPSASTPELGKPGESKPQSAGEPSAPQSAPRTSLKRTLSVGLIGAVLPIAFTMVTVVVAQLLGYHLHPNYQGPNAGVSPSILQAVALWIGAAVMAPVSEEAIFRGGLQGRLTKLAQKLHLGSFVAPALITSVVFVLLHETSDPVLFGTRLVHALALSWIYKKEGILASMAAHGFFNGLLAVSIVAGAFGMPWLALVAGPLALWGAVRGAKLIGRQKGDIASGALTPKPLTAPIALALAALLTLGYFFIMPNVIWPIGVVALLIKAFSARRK